MFPDTDNLVYEIKTEDVYEDLVRIKKILDFSKYSAKSKYYYDSNKLVVGKMEYETGSIVIEEFVRLKPKMFFSW